MAAPVPSAFTTVLELADHIALAKKAIATVLETVEADESLSGTKSLVFMDNTFLLFFVYKYSLP